MVIHDNPKCSSFEVDGALLGRRGVVRVIRRIPSACVLREPKWLSRFREVEFCEFEINGEVFFVEEEEHGGRYLVAPRGIGPSSNLEMVRGAFAKVRPLFGLLLFERGA